MKKLAFIAPLLAFVLPAVAFAEGSTAVAQGNAIDIIYFVRDALSLMIPLLMAAALVAFFWGLVRYIWTEKKESARGVMVMSLVALFIMVSVWGIIRLAQNTLGVQSGDNGVRTPAVPPQSH
jgi:type III secretory pathway component EscT